MSTNIIIGYNNYTNNEIDIYDATSYPTSILSVNAVRFLFATYYSIQNAAQGVTTLTANYEYIVATGTIAVNGFTYNVGDVFVLAATVATPNTGTVNATGYFSIYNPLLPRNVNYFAFSPSLVGETGSVFQDEQRTIRYEIYTTSFAAGTITVSTPTQYIVYGNINDYITIGGETHYVGEVFTKSSNFTFTGTPTIVQYSDTSYTDTWTDGNAQAIYQTYVNNISESVLNQSEDFKDNFLRCNTCLALPYLSSDVSIPYSTTDIQNALDVINNFLSTNNDIKQ